MAKELRFQVPNIAAASAHYVAQRLDVSPAEVYSAMLMSYINEATLDHNLKQIMAQIESNRVLIETENQSAAAGGG